MNESKRRRSISPEAQRQKRTIALTMREQNYTFEKIAQAVGVHSRTVQKWLSRADVDGEVAAIQGKPRGYAVGENRQLRAASTGASTCKPSRLFSESK